MERDQGGAVAEVTKIFESDGTPSYYVPAPLTVITAIVTKEMERGFTEQELAEAGGLQGAIAMVVLEAARYGTITEQAHEVKVA